MAVLYLLLGGSDDRPRSTPRPTPARRSADDAAYLITRRPTPRRRAPPTCCVERRRHRRGRRRSRHAGDAEVVDADGLVALPGLVDLHTHLREPGREDAETVETGTPAAALGGFTAVHAMANTDPVADTAGVVEQVWRLGREAGLVRRAAGRRGHRRAWPASELAELGAMADSRGRGCGSSPTTATASHDARADAPGAGVRQGVRRRHRPARAGAAAHRGRAR